MNEHSLSPPPTGTRAQLVDAAERVLRVKGLARATTKEIAREAGYAEGTLYLHFADKLDLVRAVHEGLLPAFVELVDAHGSGTCRPGPAQPGSAPSTATSATGCRTTPR
jgi:AcrR family transcriptional regulator